jgi:hypothetical protein
MGAAAELPRLPLRAHAPHGSNWSVGHDAPTWLAGQHLLAVPMATLLASPDWKALALHPQGNAAFVAEVRRTIDPDYVWKPYPYWRYIEPIARTLLEGREDAEGLATLAEYRRTHGRPDPPSEIIQSGELCQDNRDEGVAAVSVDLTHRRSESCPGVSGGLRRDTPVSVELTQSQLIWRIRSPSQ